MKYQCDKKNRFVIIENEGTDTQEDKQISAMLEKSPILRATAKKVVESLIPAMELLLKE